MYYVQDHLCVHVVMCTIPEGSQTLLLPEECAKLQWSFGVVKSNDKLEGLDSYSRLTE